MPIISSLAYVITLAALVVAIVGTAVRYRLYKIASRAASQGLRSGSPVATIQWSHYYWWCCTWDIIITRLGWIAARVVLNSPVGPYVAHLLAAGAMALARAITRAYPDLAADVGRLPLSNISSIFVSREGLCLLSLGIALFIENRRFVLLVRRFLWNKSKTDAADGSAYLKRHAHEWVVVKPLGFVPRGSWASTAAQKKLKLLHLKAAMVTADRPLFRPSDDEKYSFGSGRAAGEDALQLLNNLSHKNTRWCSTCDFSSAGAGTWKVAREEETAEEAPFTILRFPADDEPRRLQLRVYARSGAAAMDQFEARGNADVPDTAAPFIPRRGSALLALSSPDAHGLEELWDANPLLANRIVNTYFADATAGGADDAPATEIEVFTIHDDGAAMQVAPASTPPTSTARRGLASWLCASGTEETISRADRAISQPSTAPRMESVGVLRVAIRRYQHSPASGSSRSKEKTPPLPGPSCDVLYRSLNAKYGAALDRFVSAINQFIFAGDPSDVFRQLAEAPLRTLSPRIWRVVRLIPTLDESSPMRASWLRFVERVQRTIIRGVVAPLVYLLAPTAYHAASQTSYMDMSSPRSVQKGGDSTGSSSSESSSPGDTSPSSTPRSLAPETRDYAAEALLLAKTLRRWVIRKVIDEKPYAMTTAFFYAAIPLAVAAHIAVMQFPLVSTAMYLLSSTIRLALLVLLETMTLYAPWYMGKMLLAKDTCCDVPESGAPSNRAENTYDDPVSSLLGALPAPQRPPSRGSAVYSSFEHQGHIRLLFYLHALQWIHTFDPLLLLIVVTPLPSTITPVHPTASLMARDAVSQVSLSWLPSGVVRGSLALLVGCGWPLLNGIAFATMLLRILSGVYALLAPESVLFKWLTSHY